MIEYRPCIVTKLVYPSDKKQPVQWKEHKAIFHKWIKSRVPEYVNICVEDTDIVRKKCVGFNDTLLAVVEYDDGTIREACPQNIRFVDGKVNETFHDLERTWNKITEYIGSYPEEYENVLVKTENNKIYVGYRNDDFDWEMEFEAKIYRIEKVIEWKRL